MPPVMPVEIPRLEAERIDYVRRQVEMREAKRIFAIECPWCQTHHMPSDNPDAPQPFCCERFLSALKEAVRG